MSWVEQELQSRKQLALSPERISVLDQAKGEGFPVITKETSFGNKQVEPIQFREIRSPGHFEAEFAKRSGDIIFHFWPWGLHAADSAGVPRPAFPKGFKDELQKAMTDVFGGEGLDVEDDRDMGAYFVKVAGFGGKQFWSDLAIRAATALHKSLGGE
jgi:hypothetical protein